MAYNFTVTVGGWPGGTAVLFQNFLEFTGGVSPAVDASASNVTASSGASFLSGNVTTTANGDVIVGVVTAAYVTGSSPPLIISAGAGFTQGLGAGVVTGLFSDEYQIQGSAGSINPSFSFSPTQSSNAVGVTGAFSSGGGTYTFVQKKGQGTTGLGSGTVSVTLTPTSTPTIGDLLVCTIGASPSGLTSVNVLDSNGVVWNRLIIADSGGLFYSAIFWTIYAATNATVILGGENATFGVNAPTASGTSNVSLTGENATFGIGTLSISADTLVPALTGRNATFSVGTLTATGTSTVIVPGSVFQFGWGGG